MILLRCCDVKNSAEFAINMSYFRYHLDFTNAPKTLKDDQGIETPFNKDEFKGI